MKDKVKPHPLPWYPARLTKGQARAIQSLHEGVASDVQQKQVLYTIVKIIAAADDMEFRPDDKGGERASCFASGKRYVGQELRRYVDMTGEEIESLPD